MDAVNSGVKPSFQRGSFSPFREEQNSETKFTQDDRVDDDVSFVGAKPIQDTGMGRRFGGFAQTVRVDRILYNLSVDSELIGTKKSFCGQARSQLMAPLICGTVWRTRR